MSDSTTAQIQNLLERFVGGDPTAKVAPVGVAENRLVELTWLFRGFPRGREHDDTMGIFQEA